MNSKRIGFHRWLPAFLAILLLGVLACNHTESSLRPAPHFTLKDLEGRRVSLNEFDGMIVLLDFWATWCPPCRQSIPELIKLQDRYGDEGLVIVGVSLDDPERTSDRALQDFIEQNSINYPVLRGEEAVVRDYFGDEKVGIPTMFVINREGEIVDRHVGFVPGAVEESLAKVL